MFLVFHSAAWSRSRWYRTIPLFSADDLIAAAPRRVEDIMRLLLHREDKRFEVSRKFPSTEALSWPLQANPQ
jgi:hypothetical protein